MKYDDELNNCKQEIKEIKKRIDKDKFDSSVKYLVRYAVIRASGNIETIFKDMIFEYVSYECNPRAYKFLNNNTKKNSCNPSIFNIKKMLNSIDSQLSERFEKKFKSKNFKRIDKSLKNLVKHRNNIAHGNIAMTCSIEQVIAYYNKASQVLPLLKNILDTATPPSMDIDEDED